MNSDKLIIGVIVAITLGIFGFIAFTSLKTPTTGTDGLDPQEIIGSAPHSKGANTSSAEIVLVEFSDYECPYCGSIFPEVEALPTQIENLSVVYRHFPLNIHKYSLLSAKASEAAANQGKFWEYSEKLFSNQLALTNDDLNKYAEELGLNMDQFKADFGSKEIADRVQEDLDLATKLNLRGTPTFFVVKDQKAEEVKLANTTTLTQYIKDKYVNTSSTSTEETTLGNGTKVIQDNSAQDLNVSLMADAINAIDNAFPDLGVTPTEITGINPIQWPNAALGCEQEGQAYAEVVTPGYIITLNRSGEDMQFHANQDFSSVVTCK